jgi:acid phosphatase type 7
MKLRIHHLACLLLPFVTDGSFLAAQAADGGQPERIILNLTTTPASSMAVTWRTADLQADPFAEFAVATAGPEFAKATTKVAARAEAHVTDAGATVHHYSAILEGLTPETCYAYRVGSGAGQSEWNQFTTASAEAKPFQFVWFGDPQDDIAEHCTRVFQQTVRTAPQADFWLFSGDLCSAPEDDLWGELFFAAGFNFRLTPSVMTPGNHDMAFLMANGKHVLDEKGKKDRGDTVAATWRAHFTLPENGPTGLEEATFHFDYQGVRLIMISSTREPLDQAPWLEGLLKDNPNRWTILTFHHPLYSTGRTRDGQTTRQAFQALIDRYSVDLVLTGHDHTYARSHPLKGGQVAPAGERGTVYVVSSSGPKTYVAQPLYHGLMAKTGEGLQLFQVIGIDGGRLDYACHTATGQVYDTFTLSK